ncbi:MAG: sigma 54-interacting transcriptional regulator [Terriglobales bacterium]
MQAFARDPDEDLPPAEVAGQFPKKQADAQDSKTEILLAITDLIAGGRSLPGLFEELAPLLQESADCQVVSFALYDSTQNRILTRYWKQETEMGPWSTFLVEDSPDGWVWQHQDVLTFPDLEQETRFAAALGELRKLEVRSYTVFPLSTPQRQYGALGIGKRGPAAEIAREFMERIARLLALVVENRQVHREWQEQQSRLQSLVAIGRELNSTLEIEQLIPLVFANMRQITNYDYARLMLLEMNGRTLGVRAVDPAQGAMSQLREGQRIPLASAISAQSMERRLVTFHDANEMDLYTNPTITELRASGVQSLCCVPLLMGNRALGTLVLGATREAAFSQEDGEYLQQVATQIAAAIHNASAYREVAQAKDRLTQEKKYLESEIRGEQRLDDIVGNSPALKRVLDHAEIVANTDATVLITGETGTGKERVARAIHLMSSRRDRNFIKLNCAAIPTGLLESELFGHEKGAFTGAVNLKVGRLELADKGTLLLDEIGEVPLELQPKLLRVLQDQEFERLGGTRTIRVDVRLIAATNRDLVQAMEEREFRSDLYYRLNVFPLHLPALRERREDIPLLIRHFVEKCAERLNKEIDFIPDEAVEAMMNWRWPGNIRELENFIERSVILSENNRLRPPLAELRQEPARRPPDLERTLRDRERDHIIEILRQTRGVLSGAKGAATRLGLKRTTLQYKMQKLGISRSDYLD